ncbi:MAG: NAD-dependent epimerase/dehydratase family protein [Verrucomicrobia bacterium]|nr:NAD-dependent epimerase/dehydratase family protein [Verrucomicrobiota bacterium]
MPHSPAPSARATSFDSQPWNRVLITGGAGFIGSHLIDRFLAEGKTITAIDDLSTGRPENLALARASDRFRFITGKVSTLPNLSSLIEDSDLVIHLAAAVGVELVVKSPIQTIETNLQETRALLEANRSRVPVVLASTSEVYGKSAKEAFSEDDDLLIGPSHLGRWSYACSKLMDEFLAMAHSQERGLPVLIVRLFNTVGPRQTGAYGMVLPRFIEAARRGDPLRVYGNGEQSRCFGFVEDVVEAIGLLIRQPRAWGQVVNVGSDCEITIEQLARQIIRELGSRSSVVKIPYSEAYAPGFEDMNRRKPVIQKLIGLTGYKPSTPLTEIIRRTAEYSSLRS